MLYKDFRNPNGNNNRGNRPYKPFKEEGFANTEATPFVGKSGRSRFFKTVK